MQAACSGFIPKYTGCTIQHNTQLFVAYEYSEYHICRISTKIELLLRLNIPTAVTTLGLRIQQLVVPPTPSNKNPGEVLSKSRLFVLNTPPYTLVTSSGCYYYGGMAIPYHTILTRSHDGPEKPISLHYIWFPILKYFPQKCCETDDLVHPNAKRFLSKTWVVTTRVLVNG